MEYSKLNDNELRVEFREAVKQYIFILLHCQYDEISEDGTIKDKLLGEILKEMRRRKTTHS